MWIDTYGRRCEEAMVDPARGQRLIRVAHGGCTRTLHPTLRPAASAGMHGRDLKATAQGDPPVTADEAGSAGARTTSTSAAGWRTCSCSWSRLRGADG